MPDPFLFPLMKILHPTDGGMDYIAASTTTPAICNKYLDYVQHCNCTKVKGVPLLKTSITMYSMIE